MLKLADLVMRYGDKTAIDGVSMEVKAGQILALLGSNGAGKTSLVAAIAGLKPHASGRVELSPALGPRPTAGIATQFVSLYPGLTVAANLRFFADLARLDTSEARSKIADTAAELGFEHLLPRLVATLSGGEQRLAHVAVALVCNPGLLILDEPTAALDQEVRERLLEAIRRRARTGSAVLYTTHYLPEVEALDASVAVLQEGRIIASGQVDEIISRHGCTFVEVSFEGAAPKIKAGQTFGEHGVLLIRLDGGKAELPKFIAGLGEAASRLKALSIVPPNLDSALIEITGRRFCEQ